MLNKNTVLLFTLKTCAPCNALKEDILRHKEELDKIADIAYIDMDDISSVEKATKFNVRAAPTTVIHGLDGHIYYSGTAIKDAYKLIETIKEANK